MAERTPVEKEHKFPLEIKPSFLEITGEHSSAKIEEYDEDENVYACFEKLTDDVIQSGLIKNGQHGGTPTPTSAFAERTCKTTFSHLHADIIAKITKDFSQYDLQKLALTSQVMNDLILTAQPKAKDAAPEIKSSINVVAPFFESLLSSLSVNELNNCDVDKWRFFLIMFHGEKVTDLKKAVQTITQMFDTNVQKGKAIVILSLQTHSSLEQRIFIHNHDNVTHLQLLYSLMFLSGVKVDPTDLPEFVRDNSSIKLKLLDYFNMCDGLTCVNGVTTLNYTIDGETTVKHMSNKRNAIAFLASQCLGKTEYTQIQQKQYYVQKSLNIPKFFKKFTILYTPHITKCFIKQANAAYTKVDERILRIATHKKQRIKVPQPIDVEPKHGKTPNTRKLFVQYTHDHWNEIVKPKNAEKRKELRVILEKVRTKEIEDLIVELGKELDKLTIEIEKLGKDHEKKPKNIKKLKKSIKSKGKQKKEIENWWKMVFYSVKIVWWMSTEHIKLLADNIMFIKNYHYDHYDDEEYSDDFEDEDVADATIVNAPVVNAHVADALDADALDADDDEDDDVGMDDDSEDDDSDDDYSDNEEDDDDDDSLDVNDPNFYIFTKLPIELFITQPFDNLFIDKMVKLINSNHTFLIALPMTYYECIALHFKKADTPFVTSIVEDMSNYYQLCMDNIIPTILTTFETTETPTMSNVIKASNEHSYGKNAEITKKVTTTLIEHYKPYVTHIFKVRFNDPLKISDLDYVTENYINYLAEQIYGDGITHVIEDMKLGSYKEYDYVFLGIIKEIMQDVNINGCAHLISHKYQEKCEASCDTSNILVAGAKDMILLEFKKKWQLYIDKTFIDNYMWINSIDTVHERFKTEFSQLFIKITQLDYYITAFATDTLKPLFQSVVNIIKPMISQPNMQTISNAKVIETVFGTIASYFDINRKQMEKHIFQTMKQHIKHCYTENTYNKCMYDACYMACKQTVRIIFIIMHAHLLNVQGATNREGDLVYYNAMDASTTFDGIIKSILTKLGVDPPTPVFLLGLPVLSKSEIEKPATVGPGGGKPKNKIHVLGRSRIVRLHDNKQTITYMGQQITVARAKQIEKKMERKQIQTSLNNITQKITRKRKMK